MIWIYLVEVPLTMQRIKYFKVFPIYVNVESIDDTYMQGPKPSEQRWQILIQVELSPTVSEKISFERIVDDRRTVIHRSLKLTWAPHELKNEKWKLSICLSEVSGLYDTPLRCDWHIHLNINEKTMTTLRIAIACCQHKQFAVSFYSLFYNQNSLRTKGKRKRLTWW